MGALFGPGARRLCRRTNTRVQAGYRGPTTCRAADRTMTSMTNLASNLTNTTRAYADRVAVRVDDAGLTYRELDEASARVAGLLRGRGLKPGDRVGLMMPNVAE